MHFHFRNPETALTDDQLATCRKFYHERDFDVPSRRSDGIMQIDMNFILDFHHRLLPVIQGF